MSSLIEKALSLSDAAIQFVTDGCKPADRETVTERLSICNVCSKYEPETYTCGECGCYLQIKVYIRSAKCPLGAPKWGPVKATDP